MLRLLEEGKTPSSVARSIAGSALVRLGKTCSFFGAWGSRTMGGKLYTGRNLDWEADTGVATYKVISVYHVTGTHAYASVSFAGLTGAIAGMSEKGITVHEAGDDNQEETLEVGRSRPWSLPLSTNPQIARGPSCSPAPSLLTDLAGLQGYPWSLRLRGVMEVASNHEEAMQFWNATNNTLGLNHGIGSAADDRFLALETMVRSMFSVLRPALEMTHFCPPPLTLSPACCTNPPAICQAGYTAVFADDDPREAARAVGGVQYGLPMPEAVWRTNHGYDPKFLQTAVRPVPSGDSFTRYKLLHDVIAEYADEGTPIGPLQAINLTSIVGDKGGSKLPSFISCSAPNVSKGENIVSVAFAPDPHGQGTMYLAFENGHGNSHVPACCNSYIRLHMASWFGK